MHTPSHTALGAPPEAGLRPGRILALALLAAAALPGGRIAAQEPEVQLPVPQVAVEPEADRIAAESPSANATEYTWQDGDRTLRVWLEPAEGAGGAAERDPATLVFRTESGARRTLPGGVLLLLDEDWGETETKAFFTANDIAQDKVSPLGLPNSFLIPTAPGLPSLELANTLAKKSGVEASIPNWGLDDEPH